MFIEQSSNQEFILMDCHDQGDKSIFAGAPRNLIKSGKEKG